MDISYNWLREIFPTDAEPARLAELLTGVGLAVEGIHAAGDDRVLDVDLTSNRPDCLSHFGVARELAVIEHGVAEYPAAQLQVPPGQLGGQAGEYASVVIQDPELCPRYTARIVHGVKIGPSPQWLVDRLVALGQRSVNNVADITNYVMWELGQPLHAFDLDTIPSGKIIVRRAHAGEKLTTLDRVERMLDPEMLMICDASGPIAVGGVMGGAPTEIGDATANVLIECAYFAPSSVRRTSKLLGLSTEASYRFERGADWGGVLRAQDRCIAMICELAGGTATTDAIDVFPREPETGNVTLRPSRVAALTGLNVDEEDIRRILTGLGFGRQLSYRDDGSGAMTFSVPSWRVDVSIEEDLVEEVARHTGYDRLRDELPPARGAGELQPAETQKRALRGALAATGYDEAISYSFINTVHDGRFELIPELQARGGNDPNSLVELRDSILEGAVRMRPTLLAGLLEGVRHNFNHGVRDVRLFELGRIFLANESPGELPFEREAFALAGTGGWVEEGRAGAVRELDFYDLKGALEAVVGAMRLPALSFKETEARHLRPGQSAAIVDSDGQAVGSIGRLAESVGAEFKFRQPVYVAELDLTHLLEIPAIPARYSPLARYPLVVRDISVLVSRRVNVADLIAALEAGSPVDWKGAALVDTYEGKGVPEGQRSVTLRLSYQAADRTLRDEEVDRMHGQMLDRLSSTFAAQLRT